VPDSISPPILTNYEEDFYDPFRAIKTSAAALFESEDEFHYSEMLIDAPIAFKRDFGFN
jgi:hypothetical protein